MDDKLSPRRSDDIAIAELTIQFRDFIDRYERDTEKAETDRTALLLIITNHDDFIKEIRPMYSRAMIGMGAFILGLIGLAATWLWTHMRWNP